jgi:hypothetical protein
LVDVVFLHLSRGAAADGFQRLFLLRGHHGVTAGGWLVLIGIAVPTILVPFHL